MNEEAVMSFASLVPEAKVPGEADSKRVEAATVGGGGRKKTPAVALSKSLRTAPRRLASRLRQSVWLPVILKLAGTACIMVLLAGVGVASILHGTPGVPVARGDALGASLHGAWLAPESDAGDAEATTDANPAPAPQPEQQTHQALCEPDSASGTPKASGVTSDGKIILNVASAEELTRLPGVGMKRAQAIVVLRQRLKRFRQPTDLLRVRGIGVKSLRRMLPHLVLDTPKDGGEADRDSK